MSLTIPKLWHIWHYLLAYFLLANYYMLHDRINCATSSTQTPQHITQFPLISSTRLFPSPALLLLPDHFIFFIHSSMQSDTCLHAPKINY